ncbi:hypothetical protein T4C_12066 [Trichinella pseudospiralis]|uniref:Uncharacterized protein n=1 Tax=Trichinella pseudospiralis TaxID=6337 RepID=A0A0V1GEU8_TRIPS|nr:hypothetical protein T4C_12066 [Trichinella pseudospiralis]
MVCEIVKFFHLYIVEELSLKCAFNTVYQGKSNNDMNYKC